MSAMSPILRQAEGGRLHFWCPGCDRAHAFWVGVGEGPRWEWNGSADKPTFSPSLLVRGRTLTPKGLEAWQAWHAAGKPPRAEGTVWDAEETVCHSFVTGGMIQFLGDCTHDLKGQTVPIPEWPL